jgi:hypothetical protein
MQRFEPVPVRNLKLEPGTMTEACVISRKPIDQKTEFLIQSRWQFKRENYFVKLNLSGVREIP